MHPSQVLVVISHYNARQEDDLLALLDSIDSVPPGWPFQIRIVVNQETPTPLTLPRRPSVMDVHYRPNTGYDIGAWDFGWRVSPEYPAYLFMQEECQVVREGWLKAFVDKASNPAVGLVGKRLTS